MPITMPPLPCHWRREYAAKSPRFLLKLGRAAANWLEDPVQMYVSIPASQSPGDGAIGMWGRCQLRHVVGSPTEGIVKATGPSWVKGQGGEEARKRRRRV